MDLTLAQARKMAGGLEPVLAEQEKLRASLEKHEANEQRLRAKVRSAEEEHSRMEAKLAERLKANAEEDAAELSRHETASRFRVAPDGREIDLDLETSDPLGTNSFALQCMSFTPAEGCDVRALFFVVQFYHFPPTRTECVRLVQTPTNSGRVLVREGPTGQPLLDQPPGITVRYRVSGDGVGGLSTRSLPTYLATACLHVETWDAESLIQLGTVRMPLGSMLRQGTERVETTSTLQVCSERANASESYGQLQLRMVCTGHITPIELEGRKRSLGDGCVQTVLPAPASVHRQKHLSRPRTVHNSESVAAAFSSTIKVEDATVREWRLKSAKGMILDGTGSLSPRPTSTRSSLVDGRSAAMVQLDAIRAHARNAHIRHSLQQASTRCVQLYPTFGRAEYFELVFENPYEAEHTFHLNCKHDEISVVVNAKERATFARARPELVKGAKQLDPTSMAVALKPSERVHIVFKFFSCCCGHPMSLSPEQRGQAKGSGSERSSCDGNLDASRPTGDLPEGVGGVVSLQPERGHGHIWHHTDPIAARTLVITLDVDDSIQMGARLEVEVTPNPAVVDARIHFYRPQNEWFRSVVAVQDYMIPRGKGGRDRPRDGGWRALCTRGDVVASVTEQAASKNSTAAKRPPRLNLELRGRAGSAPRVETFFIILYQDGYDATPRGLWQVVLHSLEDRPILTTAGQAAETQLAMRLLNDYGASSATAPRNVVYRSSAPASLEIAPSNETKLGLGGLVEASASVRPGRPVGHHSWVVTCVEADGRLAQRELLWSWLVSTTVAPALISRRYEAYGLPVRILNCHAALSPKTCGIMSDLYCRTFVAYGLVLTFQMLPVCGCSMTRRNESRYVTKTSTRVRGHSLCTLINLVSSTCHSIGWHLVRELRRLWS